LSTLILLGIGLLSLSNCIGTVKFEPKDNFQPINIEDKVAKKFTLQVDKLAEILEKVHKIGVPVPIILKRVKSTENFVWEGEIPPDAEIIGYLVPEHNKIVAKIEQGKLMSEISELLVQRVQIEVETYNALIDYAKLQQVIIEHYRSLWINAETRVLELQHELTVQKIEDRAILGVVTAAGIVAVIILL